MRGDEMKELIIIEEIRTKLGQRIRTKVDFSSVPAGTEGIVAQVDNYNKPTLGIVWDMPRQVPLMDWFSVDEYNRYLEEMESRPWTGPVWDCGHLGWKRLFIRPAQAGGYELCIAVPINEGAFVLGAYERLETTRDEAMRLQGNKQAAANQIRFR